MSGFAAAPTAALEAVRLNLLAGLDRVAGSLDDGTFTTCGPKGAAPPAQSGHLTLALLDGVDRELETRTDRSPT
ncbi:hypothetical protein [Dactylosporangium salmoneum]|uniref:Uncharacterized protein n=1 Tax=Dactylosporangium salmoneum TaxID=53361 RepID=A0ABN3G9Z5_9ACTN